MIKNIVRFFKKGKKNIKIKTYKAMTVKTILDCCGKPKGGTRPKPTRPK